MFSNTTVVITKQEKEQKPHTVLKLASILLRQFFKPNNLKKFDLERTAEAVLNELLYVKKLGTVIQKKEKLS